MDTLCHSVRHGTTIAIRDHTAQGPGVDPATLGFGMDVIENLLSMDPWPLEPTYEAGRVSKRQCRYVGKVPVGLVA
jgi:hypothetical protein